MGDKRTTGRYLSEADVDQLARQNTQLMTELWIVKDRLAMLEALLVEQGIMAEDALDAAPPAAALAEQLDRERERFVQRIVGLPPEERTLERLKALGKP